MPPRRPSSILLSLTGMLAVFLAAAVAGGAGPAKKKAAAKKKAYDYERSKYKSRELSENSSRSYRFNAAGEPIVPDAKKAAPKKRRSEAPEDAAKENAQACGSAESCAEKKADADAL